MSRNEVEDHVAVDHPRQVDDDSFPAGHDDGALTPATGRRPVPRHDAPSRGVVRSATLRTWQGRGSWTGTTRTARVRTDADAEANEATTDERAGAAAVPGAPERSTPAPARVSGTRQASSPPRAAPRRSRTATAGARPPPPAPAPPAPSPATPRPPRRRTTRRPAGAPERPAGPGAARSAAGDASPPARRPTVRRRGRVNRRSSTCPITRRAGGRNGDRPLVLGGAAAAEGRTTGPQPRIAGPAPPTPPRARTASTAPAAGATSSRRAATTAPSGGR